MCGRLLAVLLFVHLGACATEPLDYVLPDRDLSLDPAALAEPRLIYECNKWIGEKPTDEKIFVDVAFDRRTEAEPYDHPTSRHIAAVQKHGGKIVYKFHFPAVRAWIASSEIPALYDEEPIKAVIRVTNLRRYDWSAFVGYVRPYSYQEGARRFPGYGGRVDIVLDQINAIVGLIPDESVAALRNDPNIDYVETNPPYANTECF